MSELVYDFSEQGTDDWLRARLGMPTASCFADVLASGRGGGESKTRMTYMRKLAAERLTGRPTEGFQNAHMQRGHEQEPEARKHFLFTTNRTEADITLVGFVSDPDLRAGASPDFLLGDEEGGEIKTKLGHLHLEAWENGVLPPEHRAQVQGSLWITRRKRWHFISYSPGLPILHVVVEREEPYINMLAEAVAKFNGELDAYIQRILNPKE